MKRHAFLSGVGFCTIVMAAAIGVVVSLAGQATPADPSSPAGQQPKISLGDVTISGPYRHENLSVYLVHGKELAPNRDFLTLQEALKQKKAVVHETGQVNELSVQNLSPDQAIFILAGDIVKGGRQDRIFASDQILPPQSETPIGSFCVEAGRWSARPPAMGGKAEPADRFVSSANNLRQVAASAPGQSGVWSNVSAMQEKLSRNPSVGGSVRSARSASSLQLSLENEKVQSAMKPYTKTLLPIVKGKDDVIGCVLAVNGRITAADIYVSRTLFRKVWQRHLEAAVVEAVAEQPSAKPLEPLKPEAIRIFLANADKNKTKDLTRLGEGSGMRTAARLATTEPATSVHRAIAP